MFGECLANVPFFALVLDGVSGGNVVISIRPSYLLLCALYLTEIIN